MRNLIKIELYKLFRQKRSWISFWVFALIMVLIHFGLYLEGETMFDLLLQSFKDQLVISGNIINGYLISYISLNTLWVHIPVLLVIVTADSVSGEMESGSIRNMLSSPISRVQFILAKTIATFVYIMLFMLFMIGITIIPALIIFGKGDLMVFFEGIQIILADEAPLRFFYSFAFGTLSMMTFAAISLMFSVLLRNTLAAILASLGLLVISTLLHSFAFGIFEAWKPYLFTYHMTQWQLFFLRDIPFQEILNSVLFLLGFTGLAIGIAIFKFKKTQITE
jgi:ABC-2 type transport system permease protein